MPKWKWIATIAVSGCLSAGATFWVQQNVLAAPAKAPAFTALDYQETLVSG